MKGREWMMGEIRNNSYAQLKIGASRIDAHREDLDTVTEYRMVDTGGSPDVGSSFYSKSDHDSLKTKAAISQSSFDAAAGTLLGSFYSARSTGWKFDIRDVYLGSSGARMRRHFGNENVDQLSSGYSNTVHTDLIDDADTSQAVFTAGASAAVGSTWWDDQVSDFAGYPAAMRAIYQDL